MNDKSRPFLITEHRETDERELTAQNSCAYDSP